MYHYYGVSNVLQDGRKAIAAYIHEKTAKPSTFFSNLNHHLIYEGFCLGGLVVSELREI
jgi:hypothetical protein